MKWVEISRDAFVEACCFLKKSAEVDIYPGGWYMEFGDGRYRAEGNGRGAIFYYKMKIIYKKYRLLGCKIRNSAQAVVKLDIDPVPPGKNIRSSGS